MKKKSTAKVSKYIAKINHHNYVVRLAWWIVRRYALNEDYYRCTRRFSGPRPRHAYDTRKADATASRYYMEPRKRVRAHVYSLPVGRANYES